VSRVKAGRNGQIHKEAVRCAFGVKGGYPAFFTPPLPDCNGARTETG